MNGALRKSCDLACPFARTGASRRRRPGVRPAGPARRRYRAGAAAARPAGRAARASAASALPDCAARCRYPSRAHRPARGPPGLASRRVPAARSAASSSRVSICAPARSARGASLRQARAVGVGGEDLRARTPPRRAPATCRRPGAQVEDVVSAIGGCRRARSAGCLRPALRPGPRRRPDGRRRGCRPASRMPHGLSGVGYRALELGQQLRRGSPGRR